jgi:hypothetical protein
MRGRQKCKRQMSDAFRHIESARTIVFGPEALADSAELIGEGYTLLSTRRAAASAPDVLDERQR